MELALHGSAKSMSVSDAVFGREYREDLVHQVVVAYRNAGRAGTKAQKTRSEVKGTTKKFKKQKGGGGNQQFVHRKYPHWPSTVNSANGVKFPFSSFNPMVRPE